MFRWLYDFPTLFILTLPEIEIAYQNTTLRLKTKKIKHFFKELEDSINPPNPQLL